MPPKLSQPSSSAGNSKKNLQTSQRRQKLKVEPLKAAPNNLKRVNPLNAFSNLPSSQPLSSSQISISSSKGKGKAQEVAEVEEVLLVDDFSVSPEGDLNCDGLKMDAELAVHVRKVEDVRRWLNEAFEGGPSGKLRKYRRLLLLSGPAGTAKTSTIRVLSREMGFELVEWRNSMNEESLGVIDQAFSTLSSQREYDNSFSKFEMFLHRATNCHTVFTQGSSSSQSQNTHESRGRRVIFLEDLPNVGHLTIRTRFHAALQAVVSSSHGDFVPIILVVSDPGIRGEAEDERLSSGIWRRDNDGAIDAQSVLPKDVLNGPFNPIAPTLLRKALQALLNTHYTGGKNGRKSPVSPGLLDVVVETANGDIRSAVMALQFACIRLESQSGVKSKSRKRDSKLEARVLMENITRREQGLALFHLIGRVLYNKRKGDAPAPSAQVKDIKKEQEIDKRLEDPPPLPDHLRHHDRRASRVDVDRLYTDSPIDSSLYSLYIHQNYTQFCNDLDHCEGVAEWLSWADSSGGETWYHVNPHRFHLLTLGTLHSLPSPVERRSQKVFKPEFFDFLNKEKDAWEAVRDVKSWIISQGRINGTPTEGVSVNQSDWDIGRWSPQLIATDLGAVLKTKDFRAGDPRAPSAIPPVTHHRFSHLRFVQSGFEGRQVDESDTGPGDESVVDQESGFCVDAQTEVHDGGWLESDDIEDF
ncbi:RFC checkpoint protein Rad17 [Paramarasmius palmivorus]|uniref:RFC checkpoint protein Rad17 n=1 Tax=Paramarasmius palmivorus TaxID=297713 RepID=A0AAW0EEQ8_9AGAR